MCQGFKHYWVLASVSCPFTWILSSSSNTWNLDATLCHVWTTLLRDTRPRDYSTFNCHDLHMVCFDGNTYWDWSRSNRFYWCWPQIKMNVLYFSDASYLVLLVSRTRKWAHGAVKVGLFLAPAACLVMSPLFHTCLLVLLCHSAYNHSRRPSPSGKACRAMLSDCKDIESKINLYSWQMIQFHVFCYNAGRPCLLSVFTPETDFVKLLPTTFSF